MRFERITLFVFVVTSLCTTVGSGPNGRYG